MSHAESTVAKVIVADDNPEMRSLIAGNLRDVGYDVVEVSDGEVLWTQLLESVFDDDNPRQADLVVSDIRMPGATGLEILAKLRKFNWVTPVILMTGFGDQNTHAEAHRLGAAWVFNKPFDIDALVEAARNIVAPME